MRLEQSASQARLDTQSNTSAADGVIWTMQLICEYAKCGVERSKQCPSHGNVHRMCTQDTQNIKQPYQDEESGLGTGRNPTGSKLCWQHGCDTCVATWSMGFTSLPSTIALYTWLVAP